jgi:hypothetical protein
MDKFRQKLNRTVQIVSIIFLCLSICAVIFSVYGLINARITVDYASNAFLLFVNIVILYTLVNYLLFSNYSFTEKCIVIKTAFFKDYLEYVKIKKIYFYATEEELFLETSDSADNIIRINLHGNDINAFTNELKKRLPDIPYEISLRMDSDLE